MNELKSDSMDTPVNAQQNEVLRVSSTRRPVMIKILLTRSKPGNEQPYLQKQSQDSCHGSQGGEENGGPTVAESARSDDRIAIAKLITENQRLCVQRAELLGEIDEFKAALAALRPPIQSSDDSIQRRFEGIHQAIDSWVFEAMQNYEDEALYRFSIKMKQHAKSKKPKNRTEFENFIRKSDVRSWGQYSCSNFLILSIIIQWILDVNIFRQQLPLGISSTYIPTLKDVEQAMRKSGQMKG